MLLGDFNIHMDNHTLPLTRDFLSCLDSLGFHQFVDFPTHTKGHTLDLICCSGLSPSNCSADDVHLSDHFVVSFNVTLRLSIIKTPCLISFRNIKDINIDTLSSSNNILIPNQSPTPDEQVNLYNNGLHNILDCIAPLKTQSVTLSQSAPWFTPELRSMKAKGCQLERLTIHKEMHIANICH